VLSIEWRGISRLETTSNGVVGVIEPEADVKRVCGCKGGGRVKAENLVEQNGLDSEKSCAEYVRVNV
jgi:hypothetical protein